MLGNVMIILAGTLVAMFFILLVVRPVQPWKQEPIPADDSVPAQQQRTIALPVDAVQPAPAPPRLEPH